MESTITTVLYIVWPLAFIFVFYKMVSNFKKGRRDAGFANLAGLCALIAMALAKGFIIG